MPTSIFKYDGSLLVTVPDSTIDSSTSTLRFPGKGYQNYGQPVMENLVWMLQNFAGSSAPVNPLIGQYWYDTGTNIVKIYNGVSWDSAGSVRVASSAPTAGTSQGELWFDSVNQQLYTWSGTVWLLLGPMGSIANNDPLNKAVPSNSNIDTIRLSDGTTTHQVWRVTVGGTLVAIISKDAEFETSPSVNGFGKIRPGINLNSNLTSAGVFGATNIFVNDTDSLPASDNAVGLGTYGRRFSAIHTVNGLFSSLAIGTDINADELEVAGTTYLNGGLRVKGGTTTAPLRIESNVLISTPQLGAIEFDGTDIYVTSKVGVNASRVALTSPNKLFGNVYISNTTPATSTTSGALIVAGGVGVSGNVYVEQDVRIAGDFISTVLGSQFLVPGNDGADAPGLSWANNRDTGFYTPNLNSVALSINALEKIRFHNSGAIGIGSTTEWGTAGQVLTSGGEDNPVTWANPTPTGSVIAFAGQTAPSGWLLCQGQAVSRTTYAALFAVIGTTYGNGNGTTTFEVPDLRGEFVRGFDAGRGVDSGRVFGSTQADSLKSHTHSMTYVRGAEGAGSVTDENGFLSLNSDNSFGTYTNSNVIVSTGSTETRPRNIAMQYIIKT